MDFNLTKEQEQLADTVQRFVAREYGFEARKAIRKSADGFSREVWSKLAELGLLGLLVPEEYGGLGFGAIETLLAMNGIGRGLLLEPYLPSAVLATVLLRELGSADQKETLLPQLAAGELIAVPAHGEAEARYDLNRVATSATRDGDGFVIAGRKAVVLHASGANLLLVSARTSGKPADEAGISLFLVPRDAGGVSLETYPTLDGQRASDVVLRDVRVPRAALLGPEGGALPALSSAWEVGTAALCAEAVGALQAVFDATVEYSKTRKQFGVPIGKFQALQHRMVDMLMHVEQARSMSCLAAVRISTKDAALRARDLSAAKVVVGQACRFVGQQAVQLHGGMGMTDEFHVSHYFKRLAILELSLGDTAHHLQNFVRKSTGTEGT
ncbi:MAG TPA: acyl-CoA dehydrogenase family protein [Myxococcales bacterium]|nr:acyl-CoA dehydrogenase family protein [Myxococcales bacterium]